MKACMRGFCATVDHKPVSDYSVKTKKMEAVTQFQFPAFSPHERSWFTAIFSKQVHFFQFQVTSLHR